MDGHHHPVRDWTLPHQIVLSRGSHGNTDVWCICGQTCGTGAPDDAAALLRLYHGHLAKTGAA